MKPVKTDANVTLSTWRVSNPSGIVTLLRQHGFAVTVYADMFPGRLQPVRLVIGTLTDQAKGPRTASA